MKKYRLLWTAALAVGLTLGAVGIQFNAASSYAHTPEQGAAPVQTEYTQHYSASLCSDCGFGNRKNNCAKCGKWCGSSKTPARLCSDCGFGNRKDNCVKCGKWCGSGKIPASLCSDCGFGNRKNNCAKCGKWAP